MNMPKGGNYVKLCCSPKMSKKQKNKWICQREVIM